MCEIAKRNISIELCPTSNLVLHVVPTIKTHVFKTFREYGINISISSDDPTFFGHNVGGHQFHTEEFSPTEFGSSVGSEWAKMQRLFRLTDKEMVAIYEGATASSFAELTLKNQCFAYAKLYLAFHELKTALAPFVGKPLYKMLEDYENHPNAVNLLKLQSQLQSYEEVLTPKVFEYADALKKAHDKFDQAIVRHNEDLQQRLQASHQRKDDELIIANKMRMCKL